MFVMFGRMLLFCREIREPLAEASRIGKRRFTAKLITAIDSVDRQSLPRHKAALAVVEALALDTADRTVS